jgi:nitrogenase molybdenum-iron protein beta chain
MTQQIINARNGCLLQGVLNATRAVGGFVPIIHSNPGCGFQGYLGGSLLDGPFGDDLDVPASNVSEKHVVFGGTSRLREQIKNTLKLQPGDLYVVISGCATELVGDDVAAMVREAQDEGDPIIAISAPGFKGDIYQAYALFFQAVLAQVALPEAPARRPGLVNILGLLPGPSDFWEADLHELGRLLGLAGLRVNPLFGRESGIAAWQQIPAAGLNLVFSAWGEPVARDLELRFGTPYLSFPGLPIGPEQSFHLLERVVEALGVGPDRVSALREKAEHELRGHLRKLGRLYVKYQLQKACAVVGDSALVPGLVHFLQRTFGWLVLTAVITDSPPQIERATIAADLAGGPEYAATQVIFSEDGALIEDALRASQPEIILGSALEAGVAAELGVPLLEVAHPIRQSVVLQKSYCGPRGGVTLIEDLGREILLSQQSET